MMLGATLFALSGWAMQVPLSQQDWLDEHIPGLVEVYQDLHRTPELSFQEEKTSAKMARVLEDCGFDVLTGLGGFGVAGVLRNGPGPQVMVRADMDGLPVKEQTGLPYASKQTAVELDGQTVSVMHACGHDVHMSVWIGTAQYLSTHLDSWSGTLLFVAQPSEERGVGARAMLEDGLFEKTLIPDYSLALHVTSSFPAGAVGLCEGFALANVDSVDIVVHGKGGHGSTPQVTHDPIALAARIVLGLQHIVSREISPFDPAVVTVGSIHGGTKHNIIPNEVTLQLTVRSYEAEVREQILSAIRRVAKQESLAAGFPESLAPSVTLRKEHTPAAYNDPQLTRELFSVFETALGEGSVLTTGPVMGGEDFGRFPAASGNPGCIFWLGGAPASQFAEAHARQERLPDIHHDHFAPDPEPTLRTGVQAMVAGVLHLLPVE